MPTNLVELPSELVGCICDHLCDNGLLSLRLTCTTLADKTLHPFGTRFFSSLTSVINPVSLGIAQAISRDGKLSPFVRTFCIGTEKFTLEDLADPSGSMRPGDVLEDTELKAFIRDQDVLLEDSLAATNLLGEVIRGFKQLKLIRIINHGEELEEGSTAGQAAERPDIFLPEILGMGAILRRPRRWDGWTPADHVIRGSSIEVYRAVHAVQCSVPVDVHYHYVHMLDDRAEEFDIPNDESSCYKELFDFIWDLQLLMPAAIPWMTDAGCIRFDPNKVTELTLWILNVEDGWILSKVQFTNLRRLHIKDCNICVSDLLGFLRRHSYDSIQDMSVIDMDLVASTSDGRVGWQSVFAHFLTMVNLKRLEFGWLTFDHGNLGFEGPHRDDPRFRRNIFWKGPTQIKSGLSIMAAHGNRMLNFVQLFPKNLDDWIHGPPGYMDERSTKES